jgi:hypothetical protein
VSALLGQRLAGMVDFALRFARNDRTQYRLIGSEDRPKKERDLRDSAHHQARAGPPAPLPDQRGRPRRGFYFIEVLYNRILGTPAPRCSRRWSSRGGSTRRVERLRLPNRGVSTKAGQDHGDEAPPDSDRPIAQGRPL